MTNEAVRGRRYIVRGRVQGVGFRAFVWRAAAELGLRGWVRNKLDGSVEVVAWASPRSHDRLEALLRRGPSWARVDSIEVDDAPVGEIPAGFGIEHDRW